MWLKNLSLHSQCCQTAMPTYSALLQANLPYASQKNFLKLFIYIMSIYAGKWAKIVSIWKYHWCSSNETHGVLWVLMPHTLKAQGTSPKGFWLTRLGQLTLNWSCLLATVLNLDNTHLPTTSQWILLKGSIFGSFTCFKMHLLFKNSTTISRMATPKSRSRHRVCGQQKLKSKNTDTGPLDFDSGLNSSTATCYF